MSQPLRSAIVPVYIFLCLVLGGSAQGLWSNLALQVLAVVIIGWSCLSRKSEKISPQARLLGALLGLALLLFVVQLVPLPPALWSALPGRAMVIRGFHLLGQPLPWMPVSLAPYATMETGLRLLPAIAVLAAMLLAGAYKSTWIAAAVLIGTFLGVMLGALQVGNSNPSSPFYFYSLSNFGSALGFFANANHMASLLVLSIPFLFAAVRGLRERARDERTALASFVLGIVGAAVLLVGIALNGSLAGVLLGVPVLALSALMVVPRKSNWRGKLAALAALLIVTAAAVTILIPQSQSQLSRGESVLSRQEMWSTTLPAIVDAMPMGTGIGTFANVYHLYEDPAEIVQTVVVHAHNDYLEIALETGIAGILAVLLFLAWWIRQSVSLWNSDQPDRFARAATIASGALLVHSFVDFPLRTAALSAIVAACLAMIAQPRSRRSGETEELRPTRHLSA